MKQEDPTIIEINHEKEYFTIRHFIIKVVKAALLNKPKTTK
jgi:hypothetical protein